MPAMYSRRLDRVMFAIDNSGSMKGIAWRALEHIEGLIFAMKRARLRVVQFDTRITYDETFTKADTPIKPPADGGRGKGSTFAFRGGGGTKLAPVMAQAVRDRASVVIVVTDGIVRNWPKPGRIPVIWLMTTDRVPPFGTVIRITD